MLIVCPSCATSYQVDPISLPPEGRQVRCLRCRTMWRAEPSHADKLLAAAAALAPDYGVAEDAADPNVEPATSRSPAEPDAARGRAWSDQSADMPRRGEPQMEQRTFPLSSDEDKAAAPVAAGVGRFNEGGESGAVEAPPIVPTDLDEGRPPIDFYAGDTPVGEADPPIDIETVAARRQPRSPKRRALRWPLSRLQSGILVLVLVDAVLVGWRNEIVRLLPQTASFYSLIGLPVNLRGLTFEGVATTTEQHEGVPILVVEGNIVNDARRFVDVPRLKFVVRNAARQEIYSWTAVPSRTMLPPGEAVAFRTRLASPPPDARDLILRFVTRRDIVAPTH